MNSLKKDALRSVKWTTASTVILLILSPAYLFIKTRYLTPEEFGLVAFLTIIIGILHQFEGTGVVQGVIQKDTVDSQEASTLFIFKFAISLVIAGILYLLSGQIAIWFNMISIKEYLRYFPILVILNGINRFYPSFFKIRFMFKELAISDVLTQISLIVITTVLLISGWGVWGVIYGQIFSQCIKLIIYLYYTRKYKVVSLKVYFNYNKLRPFMRFGIFTTSKTAIDCISKQMDEIAISYFLGAEVLGLYHFGKNLLEQIIQIANKSFTKILFPLFSKLKDDKNKATEVYKLLTRNLALGAFPVFLGVCVTAPIFIPFIFGEQWTGSIIIVQIFSILFIIRLFSESLSVNLLLSANKPDYIFVIEVITTVLYFVSLIVFASLGLKSVIISYSVFILVKVISLQIAAQRILILPIIQYLKLIWKPFLFSLLMVIIVYFFRINLANRLENFALLAGSIVIGALTYAILVISFDKKSIIKLYKLVKSK